MSSDGTVRPTGLVLCGGRASRFGADKALAPLHGESLLQHTLHRLESQVSALLLSVQSASTELESLGLELVPDLVQRHRGPLAGLYSGLQHLDDRGLGDWLLLTPCDAPFLPIDLASRLFGAVAEREFPISTARYAGVVQPTFSLWHVSMLDPVRDAVLGAGRGGLMSMLDCLPHISVDWAVSPQPPFFNVNTPEDLGEAGRLLDAAGGRDRH